jgi:hypothetical protein
MRNTLAQGIGYPNFHTYSLFASEQSVEELDALLGELDRLTAEPFARLKSELDSILAEQYGMSMPNFAQHIYSVFQRPGLTMKEFRPVLCRSRLVSSSLNICRVDLPV